jgi:hypothetical protein
MATIFNSKPGYVVPIYSADVVPLTLMLTGWERFPSFNAIINQASLDRSSNPQFSHSMNDTIYAYIFGERIGSLSLGGIAFAGSCQQGRNRNRTGIEDVVEYYDKYSASSSGAPVDLVIGANQALKGFLVGMSTSLTQTELQLSQFVLRFRTFPAKRRQA